MTKHASLIDRILEVLPGYKPYKTPRQFSFKEWKSAALETKDAMNEKKLGMLAAGIAYFATLAFFPLMAASVAIAAMVISGEQLQDVIQTAEQYLPGDMASLVTSQLETALQDKTQNIFIAIFAILLAIFSVSGAAQNTIKALNVCYEVEEGRKLVPLRLVSIGFTLGLIASLFVIGLLLSLNPSILASLYVPAIMVPFILAMRWVLLAFIVLIGLDVLYRYGPSRPRVKWQWVSWGAGISTVLWLVATTLFFTYVQKFANFSDTYSVFAGIIVLMTWLNVSALIMLIGAQLNNQFESQTSKRTKKRK